MTFMSAGVGAACELMAATLARERRADGTC